MDGQRLEEVVGGGGPDQDRCGLECVEAGVVHRAGDRLTNSTSTPSTWPISWISRSTRSSLGKLDDQLVDRPPGAPLEDLDADDTAAHGTDPARHRTQRPGPVW
jgi:hypothetical protein